MGKSLYEYDMHLTDGLCYALYFSNISDYVDQKVPLHWHKEFELTFVTKGKVNLFLDNVETILHEGDGIFINSEVFHGYSKAENSEAEFLTAVFDQSFITGSETENLYSTKYIYPIIENSSLSFIKFSPNIEWHCECIANIKNLFSIDAKEPYCEFFVREFLTKILCTIHKHNTSYKTPKLQGMNFTVTKMTDFIKNNYFEDISVFDIANSVNISKRDCFRKFRENLGITPLDYLDSVRIRYAALLICKTEKSITDICYEVGFSSGSYFSTKFKKSIGCSPAEYRKRQRSF